MAMRPEWIGSSVGSIKLGFPPIQNLKGEENDFSEWLHSGAALPAQGAKMNCWEAVILSASLGGLVTRDDINAAYTRVANGKEGARDDIFWALLGRTDATPVRAPDVAMVTPLLGSIIITDDQQEIGHHVFLADANGMAISHDKSDRHKGLKYHPEDGYVPVYENRGRGISSDDNMVQRRRRHLIALMKYKWEYYPTGSDLEVRFISPTVFLRWGDLPRSNA